MSIDPGVNTGICVYSKPQGASAGYDFAFRCLQLESKDHHVPLWKILTSEGPDIIICERFDSRPTPGGVGTFPLESREYIGVAKLYAAQTGRTFVLQQQAAMDLWPDSKIKALGLWQPGKKHAMDALRHMLYYMTVTMGDNSWVRLARDSA